MKFDKDKASLTVSILALIVSIASPAITYRWLNQVERDDRDRKQLVAWIASGGGGGSVGGDFDSDEVSSTESLDIIAQKTGSLPVGNVQFLLQFDPTAIPHMKVTVHSDIETEQTGLDDAGRFRIHLKNPLAPTARDVRIAVQVAMTGHTRDQAFMHMRDPLRGAWLYSDAITGLPISLPSSPRNGGGNEIR